MTPELIALSICLWAWFIGLLIAPRMKEDGWFARMFAAIARMLERGWATVTRRS